jgi:RHS repeat-associated protein
MNNSQVWSLSTLNANTLSYNLGTNGLNTTKTYNSSNFSLSSIVTTSSSGLVKGLNYSFNPINGTLNSREDYTASDLKETFTYDGLYRLTNWSVAVNGTTTSSNSLAYNNINASGNINTKSNVGTYNYTIPGKPHQLYSIVQSTPSSVPTFSESVTYTRFEKVSEINENNYNLTYTYGPDQQRVSSVMQQNGSTLYTKYYGGLYEKKILANGTTTEYFYLPASDGLAAVYIKTGSTGNMYYILKDHLGSIIGLTNSTGAIAEQYAYDPWGLRRNPTDWSFNNVSMPALLSRGFTGHEHIDELNLINMNGRVYDPVLGMFISCDNNIQASDHSQNFNRYSYCLNNPLLYTDPTGEFFLVFPTIGWSRSGGLNIGLEFCFGIPGALSFQVGCNYSFKSKDFTAYAGSSFLFNTAYVSYSTTSHWNVGYTAGASIYSGFPVSTDFLTAGVNYNITQNSLSGNVSAWDISRNGLYFNPSVNVMLYPEQTTNFVRGQGFLSNNAVLSNFVNDGDQQGALDYFGFKGTYDPSVTDSKFGDSYYGATSTSTGDITYGDLAFKNYATLYATYMKELYTSQDIANGSFHNVPSDVQGLGIDNTLEEVYGYVYAYKNQGLYNSNLIYWSGISNYQSELGMFGVSYPNYPSSFQWIYKIPRLW